jgi:ABC-type molybdate transport system substrate-binding protein
MITGLIAVVTLAAGMVSPLTSELNAAEVKVMLSAAFKEAYVELVPQFERSTGHKVVTIWAPTVEMMKRLKGGETVDLVIIAADSLEELIKLGKIARPVNLGHEEGTYLNLLHRAFIFFSERFIRRASHPERSSGDSNHLK